MTETKACSTCTIVQPLDNFGPKRGGRKAECRACDRLRPRARLRVLKRPPPALVVDETPPAVLNAAMREWRGPVLDAPLRWAA